MPTYDFNVTLFRDSLSTPWGFRLEGGRDFHKPLTIQRVFTGSPAAGELQRGDILLSIEHKDTSFMLHQTANDAIKHTGGSLHLSVRRGQYYSGSQTLPRMQSYRSTPSSQFISQPPINRSLYNHPQESFFYHEDPITNYVRNRPIEKVKDPKPILSQTGSPIMPGGSPIMSSRPTVRRYQPSHTMAVVPHLPKTQFQPNPHVKQHQNFTNTNVTATPFNDKKMVNQLQSSLTKAVHRHAPVAPSSYAAYNLAKSYNQVTYNPPSKPVQFEYDDSVHNEWKNSLKKTGFNIYEDQRQPSTQNLQTASTFALDQIHHQQPNKPRVVNLQYNTPIGLYSRQNINEELQKKVGNPSYDMQMYAATDF